MLQQVATVLSVALAASALSLAQSFHPGSGLLLADFHRVWFGVATLMALAAGYALRLPRGAGSATSASRRDRASPASAVRIATPFPDTASHPERVMAPASTLA